MTEHHPTYFEARDAYQRLADMLPLVDKLCFVAESGEVVNIGHVMRDALVEMSRLQQATTWQPIETAPDTNARILLARIRQGNVETRVGGRGIFVDGGREVDCWRDGRTIIDTRWPTHWMSLPDAPR